MNIVEYLRDSFRPPKVYMPMTEREAKALTNIIQVAKERLWIAESYPKRPAPSFDYMENLEDGDIQTINKSLKVLMEMLGKHRSDD